MVKKGLAVGIILLFIGMSIIPSTAQDVEKVTSYSANSSNYKNNYENTKIVACGNSHIIYVPDDFPTIQSAIDNATAGDAIIVRNGTYVENLTINKTLTIQSEYGYSNCTIQSNNSHGDIITINSNSVSIVGFTIVESNVFEDNQIGLYNCNGSDISYCFFNSRRGFVQSSIYIKSCFHSYIHNNTFIGRDNGGIDAHNSDYNIIYGNEFINHSRDGIRIDYSDYNNISYNYFHNENNGIYLASSENNSICFNNFSYNGRGIDESSSYNNISNNYFYANSEGIIIWSECYCDLIYHNDFRNNGEGFMIIQSGLFTIEKNNFINNKKQASFIGFLPNHWINNYWDNWHEKGPKVIIGTAYLFYFWFGYSYIYFPILWLNFDWHPAQEPYDIHGMR